MTTRTLTIAPDYGSEYEAREQQEAKPEIEVAAIGLSEDEVIAVVRAAERQRLRDAVVEAARQWHEMRLMGAGTTLSRRALMLAVDALNSFEGLTTYDPRLLFQPDHSHPDPLLPGPR